MKLSARDSALFCAKPDPSMAGALVYGEDRVEVAERARRIIADLLKDEETPEMALTRLEASEARRDQALIADAVRARGFFGGRRVVWISDAGDGLTSGIAPILSDAAPEDGFLLVTAGILPTRSKLRQAFEKARKAVAAPVYGDGLERGALLQIYQDSGGLPLSAEGESALEAAAQTLDRGAARDLAVRLALYGLSAEAPMGAADVAAIGGDLGDGDADQFLNAVLDGSAAAIGGHLARMQSQGGNAVSAGLALSRSFRTMHGVLTAVENGAPLSDAVQRVRPPVFGPRRDALARRCRRWGLSGVEGALRLLLETDSLLRGGSSLDGFAVLERTALKLALSAGRRVSG